VADCLYQIVKDFQTLIVGVLGFWGVICTLRLTSSLSRQQHERNINYERDIIKTALRAELQLLRDSFSNNSAKLKNDGSDAFFPEKVYSDAYRAFIGKIGLLSKSQASAVIEAYSSAEEVPLRLRLLSSGNSNTEEKPGYIFIKSDKVSVAIGIYGAMLPAIDKALEHLG